MTGILQIPFRNLKQSGASTWCLREGCECESRAVSVRTWSFRNKDFRVNASNVTYVTAISQHYLTLKLKLKYFFYKL